jgi:hypothetical protein
LAAFFFDNFAFGCYNQVRSGERRSLHRRSMFWGKHAGMIGTWRICQRIGFALAICFVLANSFARAQTTPSFSGAEGFGGSFTGTAPAGGWFSNATIYHVTTTADILSPDGKGAPGTLRGAFINASRSQQNSNVVVVFDVGGVFQLTNGSLDIKTVNNMYIAGQTAPSPVIVYGDTTQITHSNNTTNSNLILRYMTFRRGSATAGNSDSVTFAGGSNDGSGSVGTNLIVDHVSTAWGTDENLSVANNNTNITVQYSIISDALRTDHAYGSLIRPRINSNVTYAHNLYSNNLSRNPRPGTYNNKQLTLDFRNNVLYNWKDRAGYSGGSSEGDTENVNLNYVGNYLIAGPSTPAGAKSTTAFTKDTSNSPINLKVYQSGNAIDSDHGVNPNGVPNGADTGWNMFAATGGLPLPAADQMATPFATTGPAVTTQTAAASYDQLITKDSHGYVGNWWWQRDALDSRIINNVKNNTDPPGGVAPTDLNIAERDAMLATPTVSRAAGWDSDGDGMPNIWETAHGLNPNSAVDALTDFDSDGYVNVQEYLDELGAFPAPAPAVFSGVANGLYSRIQNWNIAFQPSRFDEVQIDNTTVTVNAIGQHAGTIKIGSQPFRGGQLDITSGWLQVDNEIVIAASGSKGTLSLSGGDLSVPLISRTQSGVFDFTGGRLHAGIVGFDLTNKGGAIAPGFRNGAVTIQDGMPIALSNIGQMRVMGNLTVQSGSLEIELASPASFDKLVVDGTATLGGSLLVSLSGGFSPQVGNLFDILDWSARTGTFSTLSLPSLAANLQWSTAQLYSEGILSVISTLPGDFNQDGQLTGADITAMLVALTDLDAYKASHNLSDANLLAIGDLDHSTFLSNADLQPLLDLVATGGGALASVPEPSSLMLFALAIPAFVLRGRYRRGFVSAIALG